jgi:antirestriction protein ArdC
MNILLLWCKAVAKGYAAPIRITYKQAQEIGAKSARASTARLWSTPTASPRPTNEKGEDGEREMAFTKGYTVLTSSRWTACPPTTTRSR